MAKKYYVVWKGRTTGIFNDWNTCKSQVYGFPGARYKSFPTLEEAEAAFQGGGKSGGRKPGTAVRSPAARSSGSTGNRQTVRTHNAAEVEALAADVKIFSDGGCEPNPGEAGSGIAVYRNDVVAELWYGLYNPKGTNNTAELNALHQALCLSEPEIGKGRSVAIFCDSKYAIQCITQWAVNWKKQGWTKKGGEIKNLALIQDIFALYETLKEKISILHVNGHVGIEGNELADRMSMVAVENRETEFALYDEVIDIPAILAMRAG